MFVTKKKHEKILADKQKELYESESKRYDLQRELDRLKSKMKVYEKVVYEDEEGLLAEMVEILEENKRLQNTDEQRRRREFEFQQAAAKQASFNRGLYVNTLSAMSLGRVW